MYGFSTIAVAEATMLAAVEAEGIYVETMANDASAIAAALYPKGTPSDKGRKPKAVQAAWDDAKSAFVAAGVPDTDDAPRKAVQRLGMVALIIAANPQGENETELSFFKRIQAARTLVMRGDGDAIAAAINGETVAPKRRDPRPPAPPAPPAPPVDGEDVEDVEDVEEPVDVDPLDVLADVLARYVAVSGELMDALKACDTAGRKVPKARKTLAESNALQVIAAMTA